MMQLPGKILKKHREELGLSLRELENISKLSRRILEALEDDQYAFFSAESYYLRFLKNYAENLKIEPQILFDAYHNVKIIESPLPIEQLTGKQKKKKIPLLFFIIFILCAVILSVATYFIMTREPATPEEPVSNLITVDRYPWMQELKDGLVLRLILDASQENLIKPELRITQVEDQYQLLSLNLDQEHRLGLAVGKTNSLPLRLHHEDGTPAAYRIEFSLQNASDSSPTILIQLNQTNEQADSSTKSLEDKFQIFEQQHQQPVPHAILQSTAPISLQLQLTFQHDSYIRYQWFGQEAQEFPVLKSKQLLLQGKAPITLWLSDVKATKIKINGQNLVPEAFQNVFVGRLEWKREGNIARLYLTPGQ